MTRQLKLEKIINRPASEVFRALSLGKLFMNCGAASDSIKIDFRVGGKYLIQFKNKTLENFGEFLEIIPNQKIVFSWCQEFGPNQEPDTRVTIELFELNAATRLVLQHSGFKDKAVCDQHEMGWTAGLNDMTTELQDGKLRLLRSFNAPVNELFAKCQSLAGLFGLIGNATQGELTFQVGGGFSLPTECGEVSGKFLEIAPNQSIVMTWLSGVTGPLQDSKVTLNFNATDSRNSKLELIHDGLLNEEEQRAHRAGWEKVTTGLSQMLSLSNA